MNALQVNVIDQVIGQDTRNGRSGCCRKAYGRAVIRARAVFASYPIIRNADLAPDDYLLMAASLDQGVR